MAVVRGACGSWKAVQRMIAADLPECRSIEGLPEHVEQMAATRHGWPGEAAQEVLRATAELRGHLPALARAVQGASEKALERVTPEVERLSAAVRRLTSAGFPPLRWFNTMVRVPPLRMQLEWLGGEPERSSAREAGALATAIAELRRLEAEPDVEAARRVARREARLAQLVAARSSPEHAVASAESEMASLLADAHPGPCRRSRPRVSRRC